MGKTRIWSLRDVAGWFQDFSNQFIFEFDRYWMMFAGSKEKYFGIISSAGRMYLSHKNWQMFPHFALCHEVLSEATLLLHEFFE